VVTLSLDTNVIIRLVRERGGNVRRRYGDALLARQAMAVSLIVFHELRLGCFRHANPEAELARVEEILADLPIELLDEQDVVSAAEAGAALARAGRNIGPFDLLIAGQALARDWTVVTSNTREFDCIPGLNVVDWTLAAD
jgi:tRNA(fMet)-specific endonuclease VapC